MNDVVGAIAGVHVVNVEGALPKLRDFSSKDTLDSCVQKYG